MAENKKEKISELQYIKGVGPVRAAALAKDGIITQKDLLNYFPRDYIDRNAISSLKSLAVKLRQDDLFESKPIPADFSLKNESIVIGQIAESEEKHFGKNKKLLKLSITDGSGGFANIIFWSFTDYYKKTYPAGEIIVISGRPELDSYGRINFHHPEIEKFHPDDEKSYREGRILPVYPMTQSMKSGKWNMRVLRQVVYSAIENQLGTIKENLSDSLLKKYKLLNRQDSFRILHFPDNIEEVGKAKFRMKFEEVFFFELFLAIRQKSSKASEPGIIIDPKSPRARRLFESLPFTLTKDQKKVINEITKDMNSGNPMNRLLQGDVGSGKTIVSLLTMLDVIDNGYQVAIMAPTEILAEQHYHTIIEYIEDLNINVVQLIGGQKTKARNQVLDKIKSGEANIVVGTHAMFESNVEYKNLGLIVIDEQHRFGVAQRGLLKKLGEKSLDKAIVPHMLVMSATPIPRTLSMTLYGDLDVSVIREMPLNRKPIKTKVIFESQLPSIYDFIKDEIKKAHQAFIVFPLVEKSEKLELKSAVEHFEKLKETIFPEQKCGLLHGQMFWYEKEETMKLFLNKHYDVLIATTVIEVGIDIPNATVMLINNSERFGLSTLHQLRGRVGRSELQSYCFLATKENYKYELRKKEVKEEERKAAIIRLKTMEETTDGFNISEVDLKLRGPGDVLGTRQSGLPSFKFLDLVKDGDIITEARREAFSIIEDDPHLRKPQNEILRNEVITQYKNDKLYFDIA
ncbi:MAG: ATP-dependent DNA helicase RecG [Ignavibacteriae bacterium]|nr:ATP-dependent DNA helicase RecG [Ignavibacteriota bacterium]